MADTTKKPEEKTEVAPTPRTMTSSGSAAPPVVGRVVESPVRVTSTEDGGKVIDPNAPEADDGQADDKKKGELRFKVQHTVVGAWPQGTILTPADLKDQNINRLLDLGAITVME